MTDYSKLFLEHYRRPRNLGDLESPDAVAILHDETCGDVLRLALTLDRPAVGEERIREIRFKAYGCAAAIAAGSVLTELTAGRSVAEARAVGAPQVVEALGGLPPGRVHAAALACETLRVALARLQ